MCFFVENNVPFLAVERASTKRCFFLLRPVVPLPKRKYLAGAVLDRVAKDIEVQTLKKMKTVNGMYLEKSSFIFAKILMFFVNFPQ